MSGARRSAPARHRVEPAGGNAQRLLGVEADASQRGGVRAQPFAVPDEVDARRRADQQRTIIQRRAVVPTTDCQGADTTGGRPGIADRRTGLGADRPRAGDEMLGVGQRIRCAGDPDRRTTRRAVQGFARDLHGGHGGGVEKQPCGRVVEDGVQLPVGVDVAGAGLTFDDEHTGPLPLAGGSTPNLAVETGADEGKHGHHHAGQRGCGGSAHRLLG